MIRAADNGDLAFIGELSGEAFAPYGRYDEVIPCWVQQRSVIAFVDEADGEALGFYALGFHSVDDEPVDDSAPAYAADLLAIAVVDAHRSEGIGRRLLEHAVSVARNARRQLRVREVVLTVAETNTGARRLFESVGFSIVPGDHGHYEGGQRALHMSLPL